MTKANVHVQLPDALSVRRKILSAAIESTAALKHYQLYRELKDREARLFIHLHSLVEQLNNFGVKIYTNEFGSLERTYFAPKDSSEVHKRQSTEEERLSAELKMIEKKLRSL